MALDWSNERYVRLYQRETPDQAVWCWQALAIWPWLLSKAERNGELQTRKGAAGMSALIRMPLEVVEAGLAELLADGCIVATAGGYAIPNYIEAQTAVSSDTKRKADQRARERLDSALSRKDDNKEVTPGHAESRGVTTGHEMSLRSDPSGTEPNRTEPTPLTPLAGGSNSSGRKPGRKAKPTDLTETERASAAVVLDRLGRRTGIGYGADRNHLHLIACRLREGVTERELRGIVAYCWTELGWEAKPEMHQYLRPETLFGPRTISKYLPGARKFLAENFPEAAPESLPSEPSPIAADLFARQQRGAS